MKASETVIELIKEFEGLRLKPYLCGSGVPTIGWGHTEGVTMQMAPITLEKAKEFLRQDLPRYEKGVNDAVRVELQQHEFDALVSFVFNVGVSAFRTSTLLRHLNDGDRSAAAEFPKWNKKRVAGRLVVEPGLVTRRAAERLLFEGRAGK